VAGTSKDAHVVKLLGSGAHRLNGDGETRYFINPDKSATLRIATFTDNTVGEISIERGIEAGLSKAEIQSAITPHFRIDERFGNAHALSLGSNKDDVSDNLGAPVRKKGEDIWIYDAASTCELPQYMTLRFELGKIVKVLFSAPPG